MRHFRGKIKVLRHDGSYLYSTLDDMRDMKVAEVINRVMDGELRWNDAQDILGYSARHILDSAASGQKFLDRQRQW